MKSKRQQQKQQTTATGINYRNKGNKSKATGKKQQAKSNRQKAKCREAKNISTITKTTLAINFN
jgi:hypothetical protein